MNDASFIYQQLSSVGAVCCRVFEKAKDTQHKSLSDLLVALLDFVLLRRKDHRCLA